MPTSDPQVRVAIGTGTIIPFVAFYAYVAADGVVEVLYLSIDMG